MAQYAPQTSASSTSKMAPDAPDVQTTTLSTTPDSSTANAKSASDSEEKEVSHDKKQSSGSSSSSSSSASKAGALSASLAASLADALDRSILTKGEAAHHKSSGNENGEKESHAKNGSIVIFKKFLQTVPHLTTDRKGIHNAPGWIALLAGAAIFTTLVARSLAQLCRTKEQDDAETEQLLESTGNICE